jgi:hypothetical protein
LRNGRARCEEWTLFDAPTESCKVRIETARVEVGKAHIEVADRGADGDIAANGLGVALISLSIIPQLDLSAPIAVEALPLIGIVCRSHECQLLLRPPNFRANHAITILPRLPTRQINPERNYGHFNARMFKRARIGCGADEFPKKHSSKYRERRHCQCRHLQ